MGIVGNGSNANYLTMGAVVNYSVLPLTVAFLVDTSSFGPSSNYCLFCSGTTATDGFYVNALTDASSHPQYFLATTLNGSFNTTSYVTPRLTNAAGLQLIVMTLRISGGSIAGEGYAHEWTNFGTLAKNAAGTVVATTLPTATTHNTVVGVRDNSTSFDSAMNGALHWLGIWNADFGDAAPTSGVANPPRIWELIAKGPLGRLDSTCKALWLFDGFDSGTVFKDMSTGGHNLTQVGTLTQAGSKANYRLAPPLIKTARYATTYLQSLPLSIATVAGLTKATATARALSITTTAALTTGRAYITTFLLSIPTTLGLTKVPGKLFALAIPTSASSSKTTNKVLALAIATSATMGKMVNKVLALAISTAASISSLLRRSGPLWVTVSDTPHVRAVIEDEV